MGMNWSRILALFLGFAILGGFLCVTQGEGRDAIPPFVGKPQESTKTEPESAKLSFLTGDDRPDWAKELPAEWNVGEAVPAHPMAPTKDSLRLRLTPPPAGSEHETGIHRDLGIELKNISDKPICVLYTYWPHVHLILRVYDPHGSLVYEQKQSDLISVVHSPSVLRLEPGKTYSVGLSILDYEKKLAPGVYEVEGIFRYGGLEFHSQRMKVNL